MRGGSPEGTSSVGVGAPQPRPLHCFGAGGRLQADAAGGAGGVCCCGCLPLDLPFERDAFPAP
eukprot:317048-Amphidinium_carterae.1